MYSMFFQSRQTLSFLFRPFPFDLKGVYAFMFAGRFLYNMIKDVQKKFVFLIFNSSWNIKIVAAS